ncbi:MAG: Cupin 2, conserved barrel [Gemmatimonadetes bacterium]|nr:Cupin 2, conserved barrel [Gemmatimonadota bacterium]
MPSHFSKISDVIHFDAAKATKADLARGTTLFAGLNCFEPGQAQHIHAHRGGKARMTVGEETLIAEAGTLVWAPAGVPHGVDEALERTVLLVSMGPPPG